MESRSPGRRNGCVEIGKGPHLVHGGPIARVATGRWFVVPRSVFDLQPEGAKAAVEIGVAPGLRIELPGDPRWKTGADGFNIVFGVRRITEARQGEV